MNKFIQKNRHLLILSLVLCMGVGFALLSTRLNINGSASIKGNIWDIYFDNIQVAEGSIEADNPTIEDKTTVNYSVTFQLPGDHFEFTVDAVNAGSVDAMLETVVSTNIDTNSLKFVEYNATYADGTSINQNDVLSANHRVTYKIYIGYKKDIDASDLSGTNTSLDLSFTTTYKKKITTTSTDEDYCISWGYPYIGEEDILGVPKTGMYRLEAWGAEGGAVEGGASGGYGGYSTGFVKLNRGDQLYVHIGGKGEDNISKEAGSIPKGGYNGGGNAGTDAETAWGAGGGATHIALVSGKLSELESHKNDNKILIAAGGGGGAGWHWDGMYASSANSGGSGGGYIGQSGTGKWYGTGGNQVAGGSQDGTDSEGYASLINSGAFGLGGAKFEANSESKGSGGGGGYYGGGSGYSDGSSAGGGSGYIANSNLLYKSMYCYGCSESSNLNTRTISTSNTTESVDSFSVRKGNGAARIIYYPPTIPFYEYPSTATGSKPLYYFMINQTQGEILFYASLDNKDEFTEFTIDVYNVYDKDTTIQELIKNTYDSSKVDYIVTYTDGTLVNVGDTFPASSKKTLKVRVKLKDNYSELSWKQYTLQLKFAK